MTRIMYDGIDSDAEIIPTNAQLVAGYVDGDYAWSTADWARFPRSVHVRIAVRSRTNAGSVLDVETGDATPAASVDWVLLRRGAGADPTVYCNASTWPAVRAAFHARSVPEPHYWIADYNGSTAIPAGAIAHQYAEASRWDLSSVADYWPGVDPAPNPTPAPIPEDVMQMQPYLGQIEPLSVHPGEYAYGIPTGATRIGFVADGYDMAPARLRVVLWNQDAPTVRDGVVFGGTAPHHHTSLELYPVKDKTGQEVPVNAVTVRREDGSAFPVGVYLW